MTKIKRSASPRIKTIAVYESARWLILNPPSNITSFSLSRTKMYTRHKLTEIHK